MGGPVHSFSKVRLAASKAGFDFCSNRDEGIHLFEMRTR